MGSSFSEGKPSCAVAVLTVLTALLSGDYHAWRVCSFWAIMLHDIRAVRVEVGPPMNIVFDDSFGPFILRVSGDLRIWGRREAESLRLVNLVRAQENLPNDMI